MPSPSAILPMLEGMVGTMAVSAAGRQEIGSWVEACKALLRSPDVRNETDIQFVAAADVDQTGEVIDTAATHLLALLVGSNSADVEEDWVMAVDADSNTLDGTAALPNTVRALIGIPAVATDGTEEYSGQVYFPPIILDTGLTISADGQDGTDPAVDDIRAWVLYRN